MFNTASVKHISAKELIHWKIGICGRRKLKE
jgi:hypothetical protein